MSLLTEKQIQDLYLHLDNVTTTKMKEVIKNWNEKQTTIQFEVDWKDAPKHTTKAQLRLYWVTESLGSELWSGSDLWDSVIIERPAPVITPHHHAEILAKYAEVAARRVDPWLEFEFRCLSDNWSKCHEFLRFYDDYEYRYTGDNK